MITFLLKMWKCEIEGFLADMDHMVKCLLISCQTSFRYAISTDCELTSTNFPARVSEGEFSKFDLNGDW